MRSVFAPDKREGDGEVGGDGGLAFVRDGAGDEKRLRPRPIVGHEEDGGANVPIRFGEDVAGIVRLQEA